MSVVSPTEIESMVERLCPISAAEIGSDKWKEQRALIEKLNYATHVAAKCKSNDYVLSSLLSHGTLNVLIHELLVMESWRHKVLPHIQPELVESPTGVHMYGSYESILVNFFECIMFHEECILGFGDDILELLDYHWRGVASLFSMQDTIHEIQQEPSKAEIALASAENQMQRFEAMYREMCIQRAMSSISCLWYIVDRLQNLPLAVMNSVLQKNDLVTGIAQVIELMPWQRRGKDRYQKFRDAHFQDVSYEDSLLVVPPEAHSWFILHCLLCSRVPREKYQYTSHKKGVIIRIKKFLQETLIDQIPALVDVQRALEELSFMEPPSGTEEKFKSSLIIEQVPRLMQSVEAQDWPAIIPRMKWLLTAPEAKMEDARRYAKLFDELYGTAEQ